MIGKKSREDLDIPPETVVQIVMENPQVRKMVIEHIKEEVEDALQATLVEAIKRGAERPSKWWEWFFLLLAGTLAGGGLATAIIYYKFLAAPLPPG